MNSQGSNNTNRVVQKNTHETLSSFGKDTAEKIVDGFVDTGKGVFEQLLGQYEQAQEKDTALEQQNQQAEQPVNRLEGTLFSFRNIEDERQMTEIKQLIEQIRQEVKMIKKADQALMSEVKDIENLTIDSIPEKPGIYHVRFLEVVLKVLELLRTKISESGTWMEALMSKKAKRGSAFASNAKKKGTQYSMSQEISNARSVQ